jgi:hypothetical protein
VKRFFTATTKFITRVKRFISIVKKFVTVERRFVTVERTWLGHHTYWLVHHTAVKRGALFLWAGDIQKAGCMVERVMDNKILFIPSAFKHGATVDDIYKAIETKIYEGPLENYYNKYAIVGFDLTGNPLEVFYNIIDDETIKVFHAMRCRNMVIAQSGL